jgi:hypothetical protein
MLNRDVFETDPEQYRIANQGVAKIVFPPESGIATDTLRGELQTFVTDGEYGRGLARLVEAYLAALGRGDQGVCGFPGFTARASRISPRCRARCGPTSSFPTEPERAVSSTRYRRICGRDCARCAPPRRARA